MKENKPEITRKLAFFIEHSSSLAVSSEGLTLEGERQYESELQAETKEALDLLKDDEDLLKASAEYDSQVRGEMMTGTIMVTLNDEELKSLFLLLEEHGADISDHLKGVVARSIHV